MADEKKPKHPGGRPTDYNEEIAALICERTATHDCGIERLCNMYDDMPTKSTIRLWKLKYPKFSVQYGDAKRKQVENFAEDIIDIADDGANDTYINGDGIEVTNWDIVARSKIRIDARKWLACKLAPKIYGDKTVIEKTTAENEVLKAELLKLRQELDSKNKKEF